MHIPLCIISPGSHFVHVVLLEHYVQLAINEEHVLHYAVALRAYPVLHCVQVVLLLQIEQFAKNKLQYLQIPESVT